MNFGAKIQNCSKSSTVVLYIIIWKIFRKKSLQEKEISKGYKKWKHTPWAKFLTRTSIEIFDQKQDWNLQSIARDNIFNNFLVIIFELNLQSCLISFSNYLNFRAKKTLRNLAKVYCPKDVEARASLRSRLKRWDLAIIPEIEKKLQAKKTRFFVCFPFF